MTDKEIKQLAQSYVDELFAYDDMQEQETIEAKNDALVMCMAFAGHMLETHCIVPKDRIYIRHAVALALMEQDKKHKKFYSGQASVLESIFGKDMFEEEKE